jgi:hypothetical protein
VLRGNGPDKFLLKLGSGGVPSRWLGTFLAAPTSYLKPVLAGLAPSAPRPPHFHFSMIPKGTK